VVQSRILKWRVNEAKKLGISLVFPSPRDIQKPIGSVKKAHRAATDRAKIKAVSAFTICVILSRQVLPQQA
jgi:hypothetical protein